MGLFGPPQHDAPHPRKLEGERVSSPLADRMRPETMDEFVGQAGASPGPTSAIFMHRGEPKDHGIFARNDRLGVSQHPVRTGGRSCFYAGPRFLLH